MIVDSLITLFVLLKITLTSMTTRSVNHTMLVDIAGNLSAIQRRVKEENDSIGSRRLISRKLLRLAEGISGIMRRSMQIT